jgi:glucose/arabinose dehydrogenase
VLKMPAYTFPTLDVDSEKGLLGVVRDAADNVYFYASTGTETVNKHHVYKGKVAGDGAITLEAKPIESGGLEGPANHDGGGLIIHKNQLYIGVGDTGLNATPPTNKYAQCLNKANGKILRINLDGTLPADNPLNDTVLATGCSMPNYGLYELDPPDRRVYAWGLRNPWRFWIDPETDLLWVGDVGEATQEEISVGPKGSNFGWPFVEGTMQYTFGVGGLKDCSALVPAGCVPPQHTYPRGATGSAVVGGLIPPRGCGWGAFEKRYFFADYQKNLGWTLDVAPDRRSAVPDSVKAAFDLPQPVSIRLGPDGALYIMSAQGLVKRLAPKSIPAGCNAYAVPAADGGADAAVDGDAAAGTPDGGAEIGPEASALDGPGSEGPGAGGAGADVAADAADARRGDGRGPDVVSSDEEDGCSCTIGRRRSSGPAGTCLLSLLGLVQALRSRQRRRRAGSLRP